MNSSQATNMSKDNDPYNHKPINNTSKNSNNNKGMVVVVYKECLKNHAAALGGNATDGCGEFMPAGEGGSIDALRCSACGCHRNFHRKEVDDGDGGGSSPSPPPYLPKCPYWSSTGGGPTPIHQSKGILKARGGPHCSGTAPANSPSMGPTTPRDLVKLEENGGKLGNKREVVNMMIEDQRQVQQQQRVEVGLNKKRHRTKFTKEQKEKMLVFAEKAGWKIQKLDEGLVQQFCQEVGIKRRVLKVWMHNNKHHFVKTNINSPLNDNISISNSSNN